MTFGTNFNFEIAGGRSGFEHIAANAGYNRSFISRMNSFFHQISPILINILLQIYKVSTGRAKKGNHDPVAMDQLGPTQYPCSNACSKLSTIGLVSAILSKCPRATLDQPGISYTNESYPASRHRETSFSASTRSG